MKATLVLIALLISFTLTSASSDSQTTEVGRVYSVYFDAVSQMPICSVSPEYESAVKALQWTVGAAPEGMQLVSAIGLFADRFGLTKEQAAELRRGFSESYQVIAADPQCAEMTSALDEIFATDPQRKGHYFAYVPTEVSATAPTILFLHGYGGNLKFYIWALKEAFPDAVIIAPTWGIGWQDAGVSFIDEACRDAKTRFNVSLGNKWLMGLSAGGPAGFTAMNIKPSDYQGYICIASGLPQKRVAALSFTQPILMLSGINDDRFWIENVRRGITEMKKQGLSLEPVELKEDHFFLLTQRTETLQIIETFIEKHSEASRIAPTIEPAYWLTRLLSPWGLTCLGLSILFALVFIKLRLRPKVDSK